MKKDLDRKLTGEQQNPLLFVFLHPFERPVTISVSGAGEVSKSVKA